MMSETTETRRPIEQADLDRVSWYHEFDFGHGLRAIPQAVELPNHRRIWRFIEAQLAQIDFKGKTVLEIGSWDGYWSFHAERAGAAAVLATDDRTQNWATGEGIWLARELLQSNIEVRQDVSIYELSALERTFDIIICFGVYYHLVDPFYGLAQLRHCCHAGTQVLLEGDVLHGTPSPHEVRLAYRQDWPTFLPAKEAFNEMVQATYFTIEAQAFLNGPPLPKKRLFRSPRPRILHDRAFTICRAYEGANRFHPYLPPFGLRRYDERFRES